jgi:hypothetical protein
VADQAWKDCLDKTAHIAQQIADVTTLAGITGYGDKERVYVGGNGTGGWFTRQAIGTPFASDNKWLVDSADGGQWLHDSWSMSVIGKHFAYIGPAPGETTAIPTPTGRVNRQFIDHGFAGSVADTTHTYTTTSNSLVTFQTYTLTVNAGDIVRFQANAVHLNSGTDVQQAAFMDVDEAGGGFNQVTGYAASWHSHATASIPLPLDINFTHVVGTGGTFTIRLRAATASGTMTVFLNNALVWVYRP